MFSSGIKLNGNKTNGWICLKLCCILYGDDTSTVGPGACACTSFTYVISFEPSRPPSFASTWRLAYCPTLLPFPEHVWRQRFHHLALSLTLTPTTATNYSDDISRPSSRPRNPFNFPGHVCRRPPAHMPRSLYSIPSGKRQSPTPYGYIFSPWNPMESHYA